MLLIQLWGWGFHDSLISLCQVVLILPAPSVSNGASASGAGDPEKGFWLLRKLSWTQIDFPGKGIRCLGISQGSFTVSSLLNVESLFLPGCLSPLHGKPS